MLNRSPCRTPYRNPIECFINVDVAVLSKARIEPDGVRVDTIFFGSEPHFPEPRISRGSDPSRIRGSERHSAGTKGLAYLFCRVGPCAFCTHFISQSSPHETLNADDGVPVGSRTCNGCNQRVTAMDPGTGLNVKQTSLTLSLLLLADPTVVLLLELRIRTVFSP